MEATNTQCDEPLISNSTFHKEKPLFSAMRTKKLLNSTIWTTVFFIPPLLSASRHVDSLSGNIVYTIAVVIFYVSFVVITAPNKINRAAMGKFGRLVNSSPGNDIQFNGSPSWNSSLMTHEKGHIERGHDIKERISHSGVYLSFESHKHGSLIARLSIFKESEKPNMPEKHWSSATMSIALLLLACESLCCGRFLFYLSVCILCPSLLSL